MKWAHSPFLVIISSTYNTQTRAHTRTELRGKVIVQSVHKMSVHSCQPTSLSQNKIRLWPVPSPAGNKKQSRSLRRKRYKRRGPSKKKKISKNAELRRRMNNNRKSMKLSRAVERRTQRPENGLIVIYNVLKICPFSWWSL